VAGWVLGYAITIPGTPQEDPLWHSSTAFVGEQFIAKFAWSRPAALRVAHERPCWRWPTPSTGTGPASITVLRDRLGTLVRPDQRGTVVRWCDWADAVLDDPGPAVLAHGDLHGDNMVWDGGELRLVVDFETAETAEPEYDLRTLPGPGLGPGLELLSAVMGHYRQITGRQLAMARVMAWHVRTALGDVLRRTDAGIPLADHRTAPEWVTDVAARFRALGIKP
jgi:hypothetical protein